METRYCIEYVNPRYPLRDDGSINVRHDRVLTLEQAEHDLTLILSFGAKILDLYMGNAVDGKTGEWKPIPMIVEYDDWFTTDWFKSLKDRVGCEANCITTKEWSEEDETIINKILSICDDFVRSFQISEASTKIIKKDVSDIDNWLKSLKDRYAWKPSEEQMDALETAISSVQSNTLESLYQDLERVKNYE